MGIFGNIVHIPEKLCIFCIHLGYSSGGGGEYAEPAELFCDKDHKLLRDIDHYILPQAIYDIDDFRQMILTAKDCKDYTLPNQKN